MSEVDLLDRVLEEADARQLAALIAEWSEAGEPLSWIARALRLDLPLLLERPELVMPCLIRRCRSLGDSAYYAGRAVDATALEALIRAWEDAWRSRRPWLRAVRPTTFPLDAGVIEEYRTTATGELALSPDGAIVGVANAVAWERVTGRRVDHVFETTAKTWTVHRLQARIVLEAGDRRIELRGRDDETFHTVVEVNDDLVIASGSFQHDPYESATEWAHYLIDVTASRIVWRGKGGCLSARQLGDAILIHGHDGLVLQAIDTGEVRARYALPFPGELVFGPDNLVVTRDDSVIRIWDLAQLPAVVPRSRADPRSLISPDGTRVLCGDLLCDARTGRVIAELDITGRGGWLEGGPPSNCYGMVDGFVIQVMPFHTTLWRSADGDALAQHREIRAHSRDAASYDPRGRTFALWTNERTLRVFNLPQARQLFETEVAIARPSYRDVRLGYSDDGRDLWWETESGEAWVMPIATLEPRRLDAHEPLPAVRTSTVDCPDGVLVIGDAAAPMDTHEATASRDGTIYIGSDHYVLVPPHP